MSRLPRLCSSGIPAHILQRRINRQAGFACGEDPQTYLRFLREAS